MTKETPFSEREGNKHEIERDSKLSSLEIAVSGPSRNSGVWLTYLPDTGVPKNMICHPRYVGLMRMAKRVSWETFRIQDMLGIIELITTSTIRRRPHSDERT